MSTTSNLSLKLLIDNKSKRVLYAEATKDAADFLFSLLSSPLGSVTKLLTTEEMIGCIGTLYKGVETLDETYMQPNLNKASVLTPAVLSPSNIALLLPQGASATTSTPKTNYYRCGNNFSKCRLHYSDVAGTRCPQCGNAMSIEMKYAGVQSSGAGESPGFVKGVVTYTVMDDLSVLVPMSTISSTMMLNKLNVTDIGSLEERTVDLGMEEGLELLKASLQSKTVLTDVFLAKTAIDIG